jgi:hypothetical protein
MAERGRHGTRDPPLDSLEVTPYPEESYEKGSDTA